MEKEVPTPEASYTVVARRYRPKTFDELIGQNHIAQALGKAIETGRVGHAYLFTGARGVGKTSTARIFAKALNLAHDTDTELAAEIAQAIDAGDDMDVIEIDGASNRGIEEIRQLRANVNVRPSRAHFKIYIIDEVHMLTNQAFNALLKTLEEPPAHVKFIFCTTDPDKIPITVLSRCQRFDFAPVKLEAIQQRLKEISLAEGYQVQDEALALLARRAAGSMRDSQSLLEQVMSFTTDEITVDQVHALLGTADESSLAAVCDALRHQDALQALALVDEATRAGADPGQLAEQLLNYLRDLMAVGVGGGPQLLKLANPVGHESLQQLANSWGVHTILSAIQILDESLVRMRASVSATTLLEVALVQICQLEKLASIPALLDALLHGGAPATSAGRPVGHTSDAEKKNARFLNAGRVAEAAGGQVNHASAAPPASPTAGAPSGSPTTQPATSSPPADKPGGTSAAATAPPPANSAPATAAPESLAANRPATTATDGAAPTGPRPASARLAQAMPANAAPASAARSGPMRPGASAQALADWRRAVATIDGMLADFAALAVAVEPQGSDHWNIVFPPGSAKPCEYCEQGQRRTDLQTALQSTLGRTIQLTFSVIPGEAPQPTAATPKSTVRAQKMREMAEHPFIKKLCELLDGEIIRVDPPLDSPPNQARPSTTNEHST